MGTPNARDLNARLMFASCMLDFGCYLPLSLYIQRSVDLFTECIQILEGAGTAYLSTWGASAAQFGLGRAKMELVRSRYTDLDDEDDDQENGNGESHYVIPQDELALVESAKATLAKGLASVKNDAEAYARQCIYAAGLFRDYAAVQRQRPTSKRSSTNLLSTLRTALDYLQQAESASGPSVTSNVHALGLRGACLYYLADHYANGEAEADRKETSKYVTEAEAALKSAVTLWDKMPDKQDEHGTEYLQLWGQTLILLSTIEPDEEEAVQYFETGVSTLKRAYQLDPGNDDLEEQLEMLGAMDGGHGDEDEDGSLHGDENGQEQEQDKE
ncbi:uncharacterized protein SPPG_06162 [Spizellomyces punctatus DAOM BR117]|uniref:Uncharacterized protein n=1 Tax=Spizellomyces punctatus (strain DAOM BR117) TaxID=645134 RepID=A0A0L0HB73_SPIPD|nr:uncharacterized protein SPPG_06162 [Spizellomyces punctatus DAOM BR117]KNC98462.1 hypothetical protein SPPG_06162 [Spizellomyces punctatus DAOM BR117]|eukprot:XP_016606502.1 hypothetical protein SPPG_06162 [Spizellomyces punctatus DAOM BR117]